MNSKPPTTTFGVVPSSSSDNLSQNSCISSRSVFSALFPFCLQYFLSLLFALVVFTCNAFLVIIFAIAPGISVLEARDSNSLSDDRRQPRLFLYCPHVLTLPLYLSGCNSLVSVFPSDGSREWYIRWFRFFSNLIERSSGTAISCCSVLVVCPVSYFPMRGFQFFRFICLFCPTLFSLRAS